MTRHITPSGRGLGWIPDLPDHRDHLFVPRVTAPAVLPNMVDLRASAAMPPVYDQGQLGCHDDKTEVLTNNGWRRWVEISGAEFLGTMNQLSGELEFQQPTALQRYDYDGPLYFLDHQSLDFALTPNHRMYQRRWNEGRRTLDVHYGFRRIDEIGWYAGLPATTTGFVGTQIDAVTIGNRFWQGDDFISLVALVASDGWVGGTESNWNTVSFCCFRDDRYDMVASLAQRIGVGEVPSRKGVWKFSDPALASWLRANLFTGTTYRSPFKRVPDIVKWSSHVQITKFLLAFGDQHISNNRQFYTSSTRMADDLQELLLRIGKRSGIYERAPRTTTMRDGRQIKAENCATDITVTEWDGDRLSLERKRQLKTDHYRGEVFCATVPNSTLVTRRNGRLLISGNSCTGNAIAGAVEYDEMRQKVPSAGLTPSRLFIYYNERVIEGTVRQDAGAMIRDGIKSVAKQGACFETGKAAWPYNILRFATRPSAACYTLAKKYTAVSYQRVIGLAQVKAALAGGDPVVFGFSVYESFEHIGADGIMPMPQPYEQQLGGHAVLAVGYDDTTQRVTVRNSWGSWGDKGYFYMPYRYIDNANLCDDFWTIHTVS